MMAGVCSVVCPTNELCQKACSTTEIDRPVEIGKLQRYLVELGWETGFDPLEKAEPNNIKVAIVGSGPAGLTCAGELAKAGFNVTVFEAKAKPGGVLRYGVPEFRLSSEFLDREIKDIKKLGVKIKCNTKIEKDGVEGLLKKGFKAVFIAPGIWEPYKVNIPGSELKNVMTATEFLEKARDGNIKDITEMVKNKNVAITGGGSVAMDVATTSKALGANKVYIIYRRSLKEMPASKDDREMALDNYVMIRPMSIVTELTGKNGHVTGLKGIETDWDKPGVFTASNLKPVKGTEFSLKIDAFIIAIGTKAESETKSLCPGLEFKEDGLVYVKKDGVSTSEKDIFAGGDIVRGAGLVVEAAGDGKKAAKTIIESFS
jgi:glutamate synthase (NADPH/NADH) small chain